MKSSLHSLIISIKDLFHSFDRKSILALSFYLLILLFLGGVLWSGYVYYSMIVQGNQTVIVGETNASTLSLQDMDAALKILDDREVESAKILIDLQLEKPTEIKENSKGSTPLPPPAPQLEL